jgi:AcrR family transcriptional regulator
MVSVKMTGAERKRVIIEATLAVIAEHGVQDATTARIAQAAGISEKTLYVYFPSRRDILIAALDIVWDRSRKNFAERTEANALDHLRTAAGRHWPASPGFVYPLYEFFAAPPGAGLREELKTRHQGSIDLLIEIIEDGKTQGSIRQEVDSEQIAWEFMSVYWAEDIAYMLGFHEFGPSGRSAKMVERILRDISEDGHR